jgi:hypothetical protein
LKETAFGPDVALVSLLVLELLCFRVRDLESFEVVRELDLLVEHLLLRAVAAEELRLCIIVSYG